jgi:hypothetical protein
LEEQIKIDELKTQIIELSTNISLTNDKITNVENTMVTNEELDDAFNTLTRFIAESSTNNYEIIRHGIPVRMTRFGCYDGTQNPQVSFMEHDLSVYLIRYNKEFYKKELINPRFNARIYKVEYHVNLERPGDYRSFNKLCASTGGPNINIGVMEGKVIKFGTVLDHEINLDRGC